MPWWAIVLVIMGFLIAFLFIIFTALDTMLDVPILKRKPARADPDVTRAER